MNILERAKAPTPKFFRVIRTIGLVLAAASATILTSPVGLVTMAGYFAVAGAVATAVSQIAVEDRSDETDTKEEEGRDNDGSAASDELNNQLL